MLAWIIDVFTNMHWGAVGQIIMIDILLGGDNAVVIALACRNLPKDQRSKGVFWGTAGAIILRVILITFAVLLLNLPFLKVVGGCLLLWIGYKLILPDDDSEEEHIKGNTKLFSAIKTIIVADMVMSIDNVIAIAGAAQQAHEAHQTMLVIFGLLVSVPFIVGGSQIIMKILDKFPVIVLFGGAMLGWIALPSDKGNRLQRSSESACGIYDPYNKALYKMICPTLLASDYKHLKYVIEEL